MVIENLISNAVKAMEVSGEKKITLLRKDKPYRPLLDVIDTGCGMTDEQKRMLFKRGFTTKESGGGVGLYRSREIIEDYYGLIQLERSELGGGTTFHLEFIKIRRKDANDEGSKRAQAGSSHNRG